jgi:hypothetical protein
VNTGVRTVSSDPLARVGEVGADELGGDRGGHPDAERDQSVLVGPGELACGTGRAHDREQSRGSQSHPEKAQRDRWDRAETPLADDVHAAPERRGRQRRGGELRAHGHLERRTGPAAAITVGTTAPSMVLRPSTGRPVSPVPI